MICDLSSLSIGWSTSMAIEFEAVLNSNGKMVYEFSRPQAVISSQSREHDGKRGLLH